MSTPPEWQIENAGADLIDRFGGYTLPAYEAAAYLFGQGYPMAVVLEAIRREPDLITDATGDIEGAVAVAGRKDALRLARAL